MDNDGDLDLAVGNNGESNQIYQNNQGLLQSDPIWTSTEEDNTLSVAWGDVDGDGDLDLASGNSLQSVRVYENQNGTLESEAAWFSKDSEITR